MGEYLQTLDVILTHPFPLFISPSFDTRERKNYTILPPPPFFQLCVFLFSNRFIPSLLNSRIAGEKKQFRTTRSQYTHERYLGRKKNKTKKTPTTNAKQQQQHKTLTRLQVMIVCMRFRRGVWLRRTLSTQERCYVVLPNAAMTASTTASSNAWNSNAVAAENRKPNKTAAAVYHRDGSASAKTPSSSSSSAVMSSSQPVQPVSHTPLCACPIEAALWSIHRRTGLFSPRGRVAAVVGHPSSAARVENLRVERGTTVSSASSSTSAHHHNHPKHSPPPPSPPLVIVDVGCLPGSAARAMRGILRNEDEKEMNQQQQEMNQQQQEMNQQQQQGKTSVRNHNRSKIPVTMNTTARLLDELLDAADAEIGKATTATTHKRRGTAGSSSRSNNAAGAAVSNTAHNHSSGGSGSDSWIISSPNNKLISSGNSRGGGGGAIIIGIDGFDPTNVAARLSGAAAASAASVDAARSSIGAHASSPPTPSPSTSASPFYRGDMLLPWTVEALAGAMGNGSCSGGGGGMDVLARHTGGVVARPSASAGMVSGGVDVVFIDVCPRLEAELAAAASAVIQQHQLRSPPPPSLNQLAPTLMAATDVGRDKNLGKLGAGGDESTRTVLEQIARELAPLHPSRHPQRCLLPDKTHQRSSVVVAAGGGRVAENAETVRSAALSLARPIPSSSSSSSSHAPTPARHSVVASPPAGAAATTMMTLPPGSSTSSSGNSSRGRSASITVVDASAAAGGYCLVPPNGSPDEGGRSANGALLSWHEAALHSHHYHTCLSASKGAGALALRPPLPPETIYGAALASTRAAVALLRPYLKQASSSSSSSLSSVYEQKGGRMLIRLCFPLPAAAAAASSSALLHQSGQHGEDEDESSSSTSSPSSSPISSALVLTPPALTGALEGIAAAMDAFVASLHAHFGAVAVVDRRVIESAPVDPALCPPRPGSGASPSSSASSTSSTVPVCRHLQLMVLADNNSGLVAAEQQHAPRAVTDNPAFLVHQRAAVAAAVGGGVGSRQSLSSSTAARHHSLVHDLPTAGIVRATADGLGSRSDNTGSHHRSDSRQQFGGVFKTMSRAAAASGQRVGPGNRSAFRHGAWSPNSGFRKSTARGSSGFVFAAAHNAMQHTSSNSGSNAYSSSHASSRAAASGGGDTIARAAAGLGGVPSLTVAAATARTTDALRASGGGGGSLTGSTSSSSKGGRSSSSRRSTTTSGRSGYYVGRYPPMLQAPAPHEALSLRLRRSAAREERDEARDAALSSLKVGMLKNGEFYTDHSDV